MRKLLISIFLLNFIWKSSLNNLPEGFVYLSELNKNFYYDIKYSNDKNFMNKKLSGYKSNICILTKKAAESLSNVQKELADFSKKKVIPLTFIIYDCYRPAKANNEIFQWILNGKEDIALKNFYYPRIKKLDILNGELFKEKSLAHNRGSTVALSIITNPSMPVKNSFNLNFPCYAPIEFRWISDPSVDMGTSFDCFDNNSFVNNTNLTYSIYGNRRLLQHLMLRFGFKLTNNQSVFHYTLANEPFLEREFDFDVEKNNN